MKRALGTLLGLLLLAAPSPAGDLLAVQFHSDALSREATLSLFVPSGEPPAGGWPVVFALHGAWGNHRDWPTATGICRSAEQLGIFTVFPDGGQFGWYLDSPVEPLSQYETHVIEEIVPLIDRVFPVRHDRDGRGILGLSMGGHGAITLAAKHPDLFGSASSLSGVLVLTDHESHEIPDRLGPLAENEALWRAHSALDLALRFIDSETRLLFDTGRDDPLVLEDNRKFHEHLQVLGVPHTYIEQPGTHNWDYWAGHIGEHLEFHAEGFRRRERTR